MSVRPAPEARSGGTRIGRLRPRGLSGTGKLLLTAAALLLLCAAVGLLLGPLLGWSPFGWAPFGSSEQECPRPQANMAKLRPSDLEGRYEGPDDMALHLGRDGARTPLHAENWPFDLFDVEDGEVGESVTGEVRKFSGGGSWEYGTSPDTEGKRDEQRSKQKYPYISLDFTTGRPADDLPAAPQYLMVGGTKDNPKLFEMDKGDSCPDAVYERQ